MPEPHSQAWDFIVFLLPWRVVCDTMKEIPSPGAQTKRRADAGPVRVVLGGLTSPAALLIPPNNCEGEATGVKAGVLALTT
jgi:hypothetical protein